MTDNINVQTCHGWGMSALFWHELEKILPDITWQHDDLGFQHHENRANHTAKTHPYDYIFAHSLGGMWALQNYPQPRKGYVFINSFYRFTDFTPETILRAMQEQLHHDIALTMQRFLKKADCTPFLANNVRWNAERLREGLEFLIQSDMEEKLQSINLPILVLTGAQDRITPLKTMQRHWSVHDLCIHDNAGHALPASHPAWCAHAIQNWISQHA